MELVVVHDLPFSIVDTQSFRDLLKYVKHDIQVLSRSTLMERIDLMFNEKVAAQIKEFQSLDSKVSITCDLWTSKNKLAFFGITAHWLDELFVCQSSLLSFKFFKGRHTGERISESLLEVLRNYGIIDRILGITCDNASNNTKFIEVMEDCMQDECPQAGFSQSWNQVIFNNFRLNAQLTLSTLFVNKSSSHSRRCTSLIMMTILKNQQMKTTILILRMTKILMELFQL